MWVPFAYAIFLFLGASFSNSKGEFDLKRTLIGLGLAAVPLAVWFSMRSRKAASERFGAWLAENEKDVLDGGAEYEGTLITAETMLVRYRATFSLVLFTFEPSSSFTPSRPGADARDAFLYSLCSMMFGFWGIPFGLISTIGSLRINLAGGERRSLYDTIHVDEEIVAVTDRAAEAATAIIAERGFAEGTAIVLEIESRDDTPVLVVQFDDQPESNPRYLVGLSNGIRVAVPRDEALSLSCASLDYDRDQFQLVFPLGEVIRSIPS